MDVQAFSFLVMVLLLCREKIRVDVTSIQILAVQTERPGDQAEEPLKIH